MKFLNKEEGENELLMVTTSKIHENELDKQEASMLTDCIKMLHRVMIQFFVTEKPARGMLIYLFCLSMVKAQTEMMAVLNKIKDKQ